LNDDFDLEKDYYNLESKKHQTITKEKYTGKVWCVSVPSGFFVTERNGKFAIQGNSAQVGIESMAQRLESIKQVIYANRSDIEIISRELKEKYFNSNTSLTTYTPFILFAFFPNS
jgi:hypothetical protein